MSIKSVKQRYSGWSREQLCNKIASLEEQVRKLKMELKVDRGVRGDTKVS